MTVPNPEKPSLQTILSPSLLDLYDLRGSIVVIIDVLRATSTIATALHNGAAAIIPVTTVDECIRTSADLGALSAGERDGRIAEGVQYGNSPFAFPTELVQHKTVVLTTTNGTRLLHMASDAGADQIITGAFVNLESVCSYITSRRQHVVLACAAWRDKVNLEDSLFAGAVIKKVAHAFTINCDASMIAKTLYEAAAGDYFNFMKANNASHYNRLMGFGLEEDLRYCLTNNLADILPLYQDGKLVALGTNDNTSL